MKQLLTILILGFSAALIVSTTPSSLEASTVRISVLFTRTGEAFYVEGYENGPVDHPFLSCPQALDSYSEAYEHRAGTPLPDFFFWDIGDEGQMVFLSELPPADDGHRFVVFFECMEGQSA